MNWFEFADENDVRAHDLYSKLIDAKSKGTSWADTWVRVKRRDERHVQYIRYEEHDEFWNGRDFVKIFTYEDSKYRVYARLPHYGEIA